MSRRVYGSSWCKRGFPRVSGDEPRMVDELEAMAMFSPRERG